MATSLPRLFNVFGDGDADDGRSSSNGSAGGDSTIFIKSRVETKPLKVNAIQVQSDAEDPTTPLELESEDRRIIMVDNDDGSSGRNSSTVLIEDEFYPAALR